jgi:hypothetical protein
MREVGKGYARYLEAVAKEVFEKECNMTNAQTISEMEEKDRKTIGIAQVQFGASADSKVVVKQFETVGIFASMQLTIDLSGYTGEKPVDEIVNEILLPVRNSVTKFIHSETMSRMHEMRAMVEGIRDGKTNREIALEVEDARGGFLDTFNKTFEPQPAAK